MFAGMKERNERGFRFRIGGDGPALLLLHGHPQTHYMWHAVAPELARAFTVVAADLPGYGRSHPVASGSKRDMARALAELMIDLGFDRFSVAGHDRGARCAYRLALDAPAIVDRLAVLDIVPTGEMWRRADKEFGLIDWHWFFLAQPAPFPESVISAAADRFYFQDRTTFAPEALADYLEAARNPNVVHGMCEDYRAGATTDHSLDEADRAAGNRIRCPILVLWSAHGELDRWFDVLAVWRRWAHSVEGKAIDAGHFMAEEQPKEVAAELRIFFQGIGRGPWRNAGHGHHPTDRG
jgi:haloacetate dehalogenase